MAGAAACGALCLAARWGSARAAGAVMLAPVWGLCAQEPVCGKVRRLEIQGPTWRAPSGARASLLPTASSSSCAVAAAGPPLRLGARALSAAGWQHSSCRATAGTPPTGEPALGELRPPLRHPAPACRPPPAVREVLRSLPFLHGVPEDIFCALLEQGQLLGGRPAASGKAVGGGGGPRSPWAPRCRASSHRAPRPRRVQPGRGDLEPRRQAPPRGAGRRLRPGAQLLHRPRRRNSGVGVRAVAGARRCRRTERALGSSGAARGQSRLVKRTLHKPPTASGVLPWERRRHRPAGSAGGGGDARWARCTPLCLGAHHPCLPVAVLAGGAPASQPELAPRHPPGMGTAVAEANALHKGPVLFRIPQVGAKQAWEGLSAALCCLLPALRVPPPRGACAAGARHARQCAPPRCRL